MLGKLIGRSTARAAVLLGIHVPAANTAAIVTLAATAGKQHLVLGCQWSYSTSPTGGRLTVTVNAVTKFDIDITAGGPGGFNFSIPGGTNQAVVITLAAGSGACVGKLNVQYVTEREGME